MLKKLGALFTSGTRELPLFPLSTVVFPGGRLPLKIFEQRYVDLFKNTLRDNATFGICAIREGSEVGEPALPSEVGTEVHVLEWDMPQTGIFHIVVEGTQRYIARSCQPDSKGLLHAQVESIQPEPACPVPQELRLSVQVLRHLLRESDWPDSHYEDAVWVGYRLAELLPFKLRVKQDLLEMNDSIARLGIIEQFLRQSAK